MGNVSGKDIEYRHYTLGDVKVIELLLSLRYKYDDYFFMNQDNPFSFDAAEILPFHEELLTTYMTLDGYIEKCKFNSNQLQLLDLIGLEHTHEEIAKELRVKTSTIKGRLITIYRRIKKENDWQWRKYFYTNKLRLKTKTCSRCKEKLPGTEEFYSDYSRSKDGFHSQCRGCR